MTENKKIGRYIIESLLGEGAMGSVFRAEDPFIKRTVAIKTVKLERTRTRDDNKEFYERFIREAQISGRLNHPNIVSIFDVGEQDGMPYIAMEYVKGETLNVFCNDVPRPSFELKLKIMAQIAGALDYAHAQGIVHRDLKPANIMVMADGTAKIMDFGIAKMSDSNLTQTGVFLGTPSYSSPEQIKEGQVDFRSDIFTFGILCHEVLSGAQPFSGSTINSILYKIANDPPSYPENMNHLPVNMVSWRTVFNRVLNKNPNQRYQTASEFVNALVGCMKLSPKAVDQFQEQLDKTVFDPDLQRKLAMGKELQRSEFERSRANPPQKASATGTQVRRSSSWPALIFLILLFGGLAVAWKLGYLQKLSPYLDQGLALLDGLGNPEKVVEEPEKPQVSLVAHEFTVISNPPGARISVSGMERGGAPLAWSWVGKNGDKLEIGATLEGYAPASVTLTWPQDLKDTISLDLEALPVDRTLSSSPPGAKLSIDGVLKGNTPLEFKFTPGRTYVIKASLSGYFPAELSYQEGITPEDKLRLNLQKVPDPGFIQVQTEMDDLSLSANGKTINGNRLELPPGVWQVRLRSAACFYDETMENIRIEAGKTQTLKTPVVINIPKLDFVGGYVKVKIDGQIVKNQKGEADTTPLVNLNIAAGSHNFQFIDDKGQVVAQKKHEVLKSELLVFTFDNPDNRP